MVKIVHVRQKKEPPEKDTRREGTTYGIYSCDTEKMADPDFRAIARLFCFGSFYKLETWLN
jgi:hypothetical protein